MMTMLDNPIWNALVTRQSHFTLGDGPARSAIPPTWPPSSPPTRPIPRRMRRMAGPGGARRGRSFLVGEGPAGSFAGLGGRATALRCSRWSANVGVSAEIGDGEDGVVLGPEDVPDMLKLTTLAFPGYFRAGTIAMGTYLGIRSRRPADRDGRPAAVPRDVSRGQRHLHASRPPGPRPCPTAHHPARRRDLRRGADAVPPRRRGEFGGEDRIREARLRRATRAVAPPHQATLIREEHRGGPEAIRRPAPTAGHTCRDESATPAPTEGIDEGRPPDPAPDGRAGIRGRRHVLGLATRLRRAPRAGQPLARGPPGPRRRATLPGPAIRHLRARQDDAGSRLALALPAPLRLHDRRDSPFRAGPRAPAAERPHDPFRRAPSDEGGGQHRRRRPA